MEGRRVDVAGTARRRPVFSSKYLLSTIESALLGPSPPSPSQRIELMHAIRSAVPSLQSLLSYPPPKASDRAQVQSKEVRLPDSTPISLDDLDVQIALKLSDELNLNEIDCVRLLVSTNQEWILFGREPLEIFRLAVGMWYTERRDLITSLYTLFRAVLLDQGLEPDLVADIQKHLEDLLNCGLRQRLTSLIKELNREEPAGFGGPTDEPYMLDCRGALVERKAVVYRERLSLGHCLVFSVLIIRMSPRDVKDVFSILKDCAVEVNNDDATVKLQITFCLLFALLIAFTSDALSIASDKAPILSHDMSFRREFHDIVLTMGNNSFVEGFVDIVRLGWSVHLMLTQEDTTAREMANINSCLELICSHNAFQFLHVEILQSAAYQNDDEDMICMYTAYTHKLMMCFLSHPLARDKVKGMKEKAMSALSPYRVSLSDDVRDKGGAKPQELFSPSCQQFISLLNVIAEIYKREPDLLFGNEDLWTFINFAGEDHTNIHTLVAFLGLLGTLASSEEGASKVFELLHGKSFRSIGWTTLFDCLSIYEQKFKQSLQNAGGILPEFQEGDAKALVAYLTVLQKVVENGNPTERKKWFPDIEPLFKLLSYENVPPYLKGALRDAIAAFLQVSPLMKDTIWSYLEQYDLPVVVGLQPGNSMQQMSTPIYDMRFELNEVEAREERYPSTISFLDLLNALIAKETDTNDRGHRFMGIFKFVYDHVFGSFNQRAYADPCEKWKLVIACLQHFKMMLSMYNVKDEDMEAVVHPQQSSVKSHGTPLEMQLPVLELLKDFMSGRVAFRNIMGILLPGVNALIHDRTSKKYGHLLEKAVNLSLEIIVLVLDKDLFLSDFWRPLYQPLDVILSQDYKQMTTLLEYVRYNFKPQVQQCAIKIMSILSSRVVGLVQLLLKSDAAKYLVEDYAACLELRLEEAVALENTKDDTGILILQLLIDNISRPVPNITHLLLKFEMDTPVEQTTLQPKYHYSCFKVILDNLDSMPRPDTNAIIYEFCFQLMYELCSDPLTGGPTMELLNSKKYQFFLKHLHTAAAPLPKRTTKQALRICTLHQRAWLLKLLALELHLADMSISTHRDTCMAILSQIFNRGSNESYTISAASESLFGDLRNTGGLSIDKSKVLELLEIVQFKSPDIRMNYSQVVSNLKFELPVEEVLKSPSQSDGVYYFSERGDHLIDLAIFHDKLWQSSSLSSDADINTLRDSIQQLVRLAWRYNKNLEEQAAQLHMLVGWSQIVEITVSKRMSFLEDRSQILFELLDSSLSACASPDCSLKMAQVLSQISLTCMARLRDERFLCPGGTDSDNVTCLDLIMVKQLPNGACHSILFKIIMTILRNESSESLRRRLYALLLCYFQHCRSILNPDVPSSILQFLLRDGQDGDDDFDLQKIDREQADLTRTNFSILKKEAQAILDVVIKDSAQGSESGKAVALYILDSLVSIDQERFFLNQLQSRGFLRSCLMDISNFSYQASWCSLDALQRLSTIEAKLAILLRISHHYMKLGADVLLSMGALEHLASSRVVGWQIKGMPRNNYKIHKDLAVGTEKHQLLLTPILRLVCSLTSLVDLSDFFEVKNKIVREVIDFVKAQQSLIDQILSIDISDCDEVNLDQINLVISILSKVWPYDENDEYGFVQVLFGMMHYLFSLEALPFSLVQSQGRSKVELMMLQIVFSLNSYLYFLVKKKSIRLQVSDILDDFGKSRLQLQPTLLLVVSLLTSTTNTLENAAEERSLLLSKIQDINELSRQEVDEIIYSCKKQDCVMGPDNIGKRRYIATVEMCRIAGDKEHLLSLSLHLAEHALNILLTHFQDNMKDFGSVDDCSLMCKKLLSTLERLEQLREDKVGRSLKIFYRTVSMLKELTIRNLTS